MRFSMRSLAVAATSAALLGVVAGCQEDNEASVNNTSVGKTSVDPKAASSYENLAPKSEMPAPPKGVAIQPVAPSGGPPPAAKEAAPEKKKD